MKQKIEEAKKNNLLSVFIEGDLTLEKLIWLTDNNYFYHKSCSIFPFINTRYTIVLDLQEYLKKIEISSDYLVLKFFQDDQKTNPFKVFTDNLSDELKFWMEYHGYSWKKIYDTRQELKHFLIKNERKN